MEIGTGNWDGSLFQKIKTQFTNQTDTFIQFKYCIGWGFKDVPEGWIEYPFKFDISIVSRIILQHLESFPVEKDIWDGSYQKGFIMKCIEEYLGSEHDGIKNPFYGIVYFEPYTCFYSK